MNTSERIIEKSGGLTKAARAVGVERSVLHHWKTRGVIPAHNWKSVLSASNKMKWGVTIEMLMEDIK
jgi:DNA invertase Pin-like site-specific DNA recombinase